MKKIIFILGFFLLAGNIFAQEKNSTEIINAWLNGYCDEGEKVQMRDKLKSVSAEAEKVFIRIIKDGVDEKTLSQVAENARERYQRRKAQIEEGRLPDFDAETMESIKKETVEDYVKRQVDDLVEGYTLQAIYGLGVIQTQEGNTTLKTLSRRPNYQYADDVKEVLGQ